MRTKKNTKTTYSCRNCGNFKSKMIKKSDLEYVSKRNLQRLIKGNAVESLELSFPINYGIYKKICRLGGLRIAYCSADQFKRSVYNFKKNFMKGSVTNRKKPCPAYK